MKTRIIALLILGLITSLHAEDDLAKRKELAATLLGFNVQVEPSLYTSAQLDDMIFDCRIKQKRGFSPPSSFPLNGDEDERKMLSAQLIIMGRSYEWQFYSVPYLKKMVAFYSKIPSASEQAALNYFAQQQQRQEQTNNLLREAVAATVAAEQQEASARGMTLQQYHEAQQQSAQAAQLAEQQRQMELYKIWLMERQVNASEANAKAAKNQADSLSDLQFQQWLKQQEKQSRR